MGGQEARVERKISGSIQKGSGLVYRAIKEQVTGEVPVTKKGQYGTKEIVAEQADIWAGWWKSEGKEEWSDFNNEKIRSRPSSTQKRS